MSTSIPAVAGEDQWNSKPAWKLPGWAEPLIVVAILFSAMWFTRKRNYRILGGPSGRQSTYLDSLPNSTRSSDEMSSDDLAMENEHQSRPLLTGEGHKKRSVFGHIFETPNTSQFKKNIQSRILQRFPFLIEMFYWVINYLFYRMTAIMSQRIFADTGIWTVAESHGLAVLEFEELGPLQFLYPFRERDIQQWFMKGGHQSILTVLNRVYALIHIPGTVGFIAWYYYVAPSHRTFARVRRTVSLVNFFAFTTFIFYPCMPPRLLPAEYGFFDTVRHDDAQSVWMSGKYVNSLAAMPSIHFAYSFCIGCTFIYHSGVFRRELEKHEARKSPFWKLFYVAFGLAYPSLILTTIVATANHYFLDACVATVYAIIALTLNKVFYLFLPIEDWLLWLLRIEKPVPSTGERFRAKGLHL